MHNKNRSNSFDSIDIAFFKEMWPWQPVKMTVSRATLPDLAEGVIFAHHLGFDVTVNLAYGLDWDDSRILKEYEEQLSLLIDFYLDNPDIEPPNMLSMAIDVLPFINVESMKKWCGAGEYMHTYDCAGTCYPCQFFMPVSAGEEKAAEIGLIDFGDRQTITDPACLGCPILPVCPTCYGSNYVETGNVAIRNKSLCKTTKLNALAVSYFRYQQIVRLWQNGEALGPKQLNFLEGIKLVQSQLN